MFHRALTLGRVHERFTIKEGNEKLVVRVDEDANVFAQKIREALARIEAAKTDIEKQGEAGVYFCRTLFGEEQTQKILDLYNGSKTAALQIASQAFVTRLARSIEKAQRKKG